MNPPADNAMTFDDPLLTRAVRGDHEAFIALATTHAPRVFAIARNLSSSDAEALQLVQGALQQAWDELAALAAPLSFRAFVSRFVVRDAMPRLRRAPAGRGQRLFGPFDADERQLELGIARRHAEISSIPDLDERIREAAEQLDADDRVALVLTIVEQIPADEAAAILETPAADLRRRVHEACLLLTGYLQHLVAASGKAAPFAAAAWIH